MRLRGIIFERFATFERAEVDLCDERGVPLDVVLFVGDTATGKSTILRGVSGLLAEAAGAPEELVSEDVRRDQPDGRCRVVFDDVVGEGRVVITLEKELVRAAAPLSRSLRGLPVAGFDRWRESLARDPAPRAASSLAEDEDDGDADPAGADGEPGETLFDWAAALAGTPAWDTTARALDEVLWPWRFESWNDDGDLVFAGPSGLAPSSELGDGFTSVLVMALELARLSIGRPTDELVYVIDDIDAHLPPRWAARLLGDLRRAFPRVQLLASTQSPWVAASVEPNQVFILERSGSATAIVRVSSRLMNGAPTSNVMDTAFGTPDLSSPRWLHVPPLSIRKEILDELDRGLERGALVYALPELVHVKEVKNGFGERLLPGADAVIGHLFFVDHHPGTPWGHSCEYVFRAGDGVLSRQRSIWPPPDLHRFVPVGRR